jgi:hypothetical protein
LIKTSIVCLKKVNPSSKYFEFIFEDVKSYFIFFKKRELQTLILTKNQIVKIANSRDEEKDIKEYFSKKIRQGLID